MGLRRLSAMWHDKHLPGQVIDITPNSVSDELLLTADLDKIDLFHIRGSEIQEWLTQNEKGVDAYVIIDDVDDFLPEQQQHLVLTNPDVGITLENARRAIALLNQL